jgi:hypothetical protein
MALMAQYPEPGGSGGGGGGGGGATSISGLTDLQLTRGSASVLNIAAGTARIGNKPVAFAAATATLSGATATSTAYVYVSSSGALTVGHNGAATITCSGCTTATGITAYPADSVPLGSWTYTNSAWDVGGGTSARTLVGGNILAAGTGISVSTDAAGVQTIATTGSGGSTIGSGVFASRSACSGSTQLYISTDSPGLSSVCNGTSWSNFFADSLVTLPTAATNWTAVNSPTVTDSGGFVSVSKSTTGLGVALLAFADTGASWDVRMAISAANMTTIPATFSECGLWVSNGTTAGTHNAWGVVIAQTQAANPSVSYLLRSYSPINGSIANEGSVWSADTAGRPIWFRITRSAGNLTAYVGDGVTWNTLQTDANGFTATHYGAGCDPRGSNKAEIKVVSVTVQ